MYIFQQEQKKIKNLGVYANFDQESIKRTLTYDYVFNKAIKSKIPIFFIAVAESIKNQTRKNKDSNRRI